MSKCRNYLDKLAVPQIVKKLPAPHETRKFITVLTTTRHFSLSSARSIQSMLSNPIYGNFNITLPYTSVSSNLITSQNKTYGVLHKENCDFTNKFLFFFFSYNLANTSNQVHNSAQYIYLLVRVKLQPADQTPPIQSDKYQCRIDTVISPDDGHMVARNMQGREINILSRIVHLVGFICKFLNSFFSTRKFAITIQLRWLHQ